jgi:UDP-GlcNAc3NAcA epimerase
MKKIVTIIGARPQFVKAAVVSRAIAAQPDLEEVIVHTGQHYGHNMSDVFFEEMEIPRPKYNLGINGVSHAEMTGKMLIEIETVLVKEMPDLLMVYGDTNSTLAGALAAQKMHIPIAHVEAGLRSYDMRMPEEANRILTDRISSLLFCPTTTAVENLNHEGFENFDAEVLNVGDVMYDAAMYYYQKTKGKTALLAEHKLTSGGYVLCTCHRQENTDDPERLAEIIAGLTAINEKTPVVWPVHPRTRKIMETSGITVPFTLIDPVGYFDMIGLLSHCKLVATDSGGLQKEAYFFKKPCLTMRDQTEWVELVTSGYNKIVGANATAIAEGYEAFADVELSFSEWLYGDGNASGKIAAELARRV